MIWITKADQRGRVTLPKSMRKDLGITAGDELDFGVPENGQVVVTRPSDGIRFVLVALCKEAA